MIPTSEGVTHGPARRAFGGRRCLPGVAAALVVAVAAVALACNAAGSAGKHEATRAADAGQQSAPPAEMVAVTLGAGGFTPAQVSHAAGRFGLRVRNESGEREVTLRLSKAGGEKVSEVKLTEKVREWAAPVELAAGTYTLSEVGHPGWTCRLEVTAQ